MTALYLEDFSAGQTFRSVSVQVTAEDILRFAREFDPQPFHLDENAARHSLMRGLAASGWHTAAMTMKLLVASDFSPAGGIVGLGFEELKWPRPVRPGDELHVASEVLEVRPSKSNGTLGVVKVRTLTLNQREEPVQIAVGAVLVPSRSRAS